MDQTVGWFVNVVLAKNTNSLTINSPYPYYIQWNIEPKIISTLLSFVLVVESGAFNFTWVEI